MADYDPQAQAQPAGVSTVPATPPYQQPVQPVVLVQSPPPEPAKQNEEPQTERRLELRIFSHSNLFYWWPVWVAGYAMALLSYLQGLPVQVGNATPEWYHESNSLGVIFFMALFLVILITNVAVRGMASAIVILTLMLGAVLLAYYDLWDDILLWAGNISVHMNMGAYLTFSTMLFIAWAAAFFVFDRMTYYRVKPGQITQEFVFGAGSRSWDTDGMILEKRRDDIFRHWILGLGSGDLQIHTMGAQRDRIDIHNVLFIGSKIQAIEHMIATEPEKFGHATLR